MRLPLDVQASEAWRRTHSCAQCYLNSCPTTDHSRIARSLKATALATLGGFVSSIRSSTQQVRISESTRAVVWI